jgi:hypothetical protein
MLGDEENATAFLSKFNLGRFSSCHPRVVFRRDAANHGQQYKRGEVEDVYLCCG